MVYGTFRDFSEHDPYIYAYTRELDGVRWLIVLNHCDNDNVYELPQELASVDRHLLLGNYTDVKEEGSALHMRPHEARIYALQ
ncbi:MAG: hypothetical protein KatS3mg080_0901 [Anoxybacillus sp.]|nr:MAG: hypothetical protein KatS3mg080_0901 [Anoxybacillus sp.]